MKLMVINAEFTKGKARGEIEVTNPATEEVLDSVPRGNAEGADVPEITFTRAVWRRDNGLRTARRA